MGSLLVTVTSAWLIGQAPGDVKGWHGAEWGMKPEQVTTVVGLPLQPLAAGTEKRCGENHSELRSTSTIEAGNSKATPSFCFSEPGGLSQILLDFQEPAAYPATRDELKAKYGAPVSESNERFAGGTVVVAESKWLLPSTEIKCMRTDLPSKSNLTVFYIQRRRSVL